MFVEPKLKRKEIIDLLRNTRPYRNGYGQWLTMVNAFALRLYGSSFAASVHRKLFIEECLK